MNQIEMATAALEVFNRTNQLYIPNDLKENDFDIWLCVFESNLDCWALIKKEEQRTLSKSVVLEYSTSTEKNSVALMNTCANLACACIRNLTSGNQKWENLFAVLRPQVKQIWIDAFIEFPDFQKLLNQKNISSSL